jgi:hypothetical protein
MGVWGCSGIIPPTNNPMRTAKSCGPGIPELMPSPWLMTSTRATGARQPVPGESAYKP